MAEKVKSSHMREILDRLTRFAHIHVCIFEEEQIFDHPIEQWPVVDALLCFHSSGFPLEKAIAYSDLRKPYLVNDLKWQRVLLDRRKVYEVLTRNNIPVPRYEVFCHVNNSSPLTYNDDSVDINGQTFHKPFVEKPVMADDHNIYIYFPSTAGGGAQRLFRKVGDRSSEYVREGNTLRQDGAYIYEEFMPTDGTDVKVYTVSEDYAHAEARKCPALDGVVERDPKGKEVRYPVILSPWEKLIAKKIVRAFKQQICGFDLLRTQGQSYVCDVNGFSFVKNSRKYYDDCAHILGTLLTRRLCPHHYLASHHPQNYLTPLLTNARSIGSGLANSHIECMSTVDGGNGALDMESIIVDTKGQPVELRCVIAVIRHADRTPKQKMKMEVRHNLMWQLFLEQGGSICPARVSRHELKLKKPKQLQKLLDIVHELLQVNHDESRVKRADLEQLRNVLELYGHFSGINRKVQLVFYPGSYYSSRSHLTSRSDYSMTESFISPMTTQALSLEEILSSRNGSGIAKNGMTESTDNFHFLSVPTEALGGNQFLNIRSCSSDDGTAAEHAHCEDREQGCQVAREEIILPSSAYLLLVAKWGGELTAAGRQQAECLGRSFRCIYPSRTGERMECGSGLLRLHSTFRHDLKIYASDEGRVQMTAAAFAKGFLALEGELAPILVQMVKSANTNGLLGSDKEGRHYKTQVKRRMHQQLMCHNAPLTPKEIEQLAPTQAPFLLRALQSIHNPVCLCQRLHDHIDSIYQRLLTIDCNDSKMSLYHNENWDLILRRWSKLLTDFRRSKCHSASSSSSSQRDLDPFDTDNDIGNEFNLSKVLDMYDNIKYDLQHNPDILNVQEANDFFQHAKALANFLAAQEYGVTEHEKLVIGQRISLQLLRKVLADARYTEQQDNQCTRLNELKIPQGVVSTPGRFVRTRLYFTSESHMHSLISCLRYGALKDEESDPRWKKAMNYIDSVSELNYLSQIVILIYEDPSKSVDESERYPVELMFSPGSYPLPRHSHSSMFSNKDDLESTSSACAYSEHMTSGSGNGEFKSHFNIKSQENITEEESVRSPSCSFIIEGFGREDSVEEMGDLRSPHRRNSLMKDQFLSVMENNDMRDHVFARNSISESDLGRLQPPTELCDEPLRVESAGFHVSLLNSPWSIGDEGDIPQQDKFRHAEDDFHQSISPERPLSRSLPHLSSNGENCSHSVDSYLDSFYRDGKCSGRLISTAVIGPPTTEKEVEEKISRRKGSSALSEDTARCIINAPCVEDVYPLETLTNSLTLSQLEDFLTRLSIDKFPTPMSSPKSPGTPVPVTSQEVNRQIPKSSNGFQF